MRAEVPPNGDGYLQAFFGKPPTRGQSPAAVHTRIAHKAAVEAWQGIYTKHTRLKADPSRTDVQRILADAEQAQKALIAARNTASTAREAARSELDSLQARIDSKLRAKDQVAAMADAELRGYLRTLKPDERTALLGEARKAADLDTIRAFASAPAYLSGLSPEMHAKVRDEFLSVVATEEVLEAQAITEGMAKADHALSELEAHTRHYIDFNAAERLIQNKVEV